MIRAKHHRVIYPLFQYITGFLLKRHFSSVNIIGDFNDQNKATLLVANHISWWDGFWMMHLNLKVIRRRFHFMMLEEQLKKHWYFAYTGGFSIKKKSKSIIETLKYTQALLKHKDNMVLMFPQGEIQSMHQNKLHFEQGINYLTKEKKTDYQLLFAACFVDYLASAKPQLWIYIESQNTDNIKQMSIEQLYQAFYTKALEQQKQHKA